LPKDGFKSITVSETVYDKFFDVYQKSKEELLMKGVNSFSGYITYMLEENMQKDKTFARYAPKLEKISVDGILIQQHPDLIPILYTQQLFSIKPVCQEEDAFHYFVISLHGVE